MYDHIGLKVKDVAASGGFCMAALAPLGPVADLSDSGFGRAGAPALWLYEGGNAKGTAHVAFVAPDRGTVDRFYKEGLKAGGRDSGKPGLRADYSPKYYAASVTDPDGK